MAQMKHLWEFLNALGLSTYFAAIITNWGDIKSIVLMILGAVAALIKAAEYGVSLAKKWQEYKQYKQDTTKQ